jgi:cytoplasmic iron level regulating protein YaaA (DUF328/UPF0246 family)
MIAILSPAKTMDLRKGTMVATYSEPRSSALSLKLVREMKKKNPEALQELMGISKKLAEENALRYRDWQWPHQAENSRQALFTFRGEVYNGFKADSLDEGGIDYAQVHLRILSGLYGLLRPLDRIAPYRLEMGLPLHLGKHTDLYSFWGDNIVKVLNQDLREQGDNILINLASQEYYKAVDRPTLKARVITPVFKERKGDKYATIAIFAKNARGKMARFITDHRIEDPQELQAFDLDGYNFRPTLSDEKTLTFTRG